MANGLLGIATSGIMAFQRSLATTSHNVANVDTKGYSRQSAELAATEPQLVGSSGYLGTGVEVSTVRRNYDVFLTAQVRTSTSAYSELDAYYQLASQVDDIIADQDGSPSGAMQTFFDSVHNVANEPTSLPVRRVMLTSAETMVNRFKVLNDNFNNIRDQVNQSIESSLAEVNALAGNLAEINKKIMTALGAGGGSPPNDLLDQRDQLLTKLAKHLDVQAVADGSGAINVFVGTGQALVMGMQAASLKTQNSAYGSSQKDIVLYASNSSNYTVVTDMLTGGTIGGVMTFRKDFLDPAQNDLGRIAAAFTFQFNAQHRAGYDLNGNAGIDFFSTPVPTVVSHANNSTGSSLTAAFSDYQALTGADYKIDVTATGVNVTNLRTNSVTAVAVPIPAGTFTHEGLNFTLSGVAAGDSFIARPTREAAGNIAVATAMNDPSLVAAASSAPVSGTARVGDNKNAIALTNLQDAKNLLNGRSSYHEAYNEIIGTVGSLTKAAEINSTAQKSLLEQATERRDAVSGVNLDEEAANLIQFQQAYQAAAQMISAAQSTFDALMGAVRS